MQQCDACAVPLKLPSDTTCTAWHHYPPLLITGFLTPALCVFCMACAVQWSFLYAEYKPQKCFWEFVIMGRKLVFLAATILLPMALDTPEETTSQMQLLVCVMLAIFFLLLHASQHPFKRDVLNRLERLGLTAIALRCVTTPALTYASQP